MTQDNLRILTRQLKAIEKTNYKFLAKELLCMNPHAFYNWLSGSYDLSYKKAKILEEYISNILS